MGRSIQLKKERQIARKQVAKVFEDFMQDFELGDYLREKPWYFPQFAWDGLIRYICKK